MPLHRSFTGLLIAVAAATVVVCGTLPASAQTVNDTQHEFKAEIEIFNIANPCTGDLGTLREIENGVYHLTSAGVDGHGDPIGPWHSTFNVENSYTFTPNNPSLPVYSGHSHTHTSYRFQSLPGTAQLENTVIGKGSDGSRLRVREIARATVRSDGSMDLQFDKMRCESA